jgi:hypothetical protein
MANLMGILGGVGQGISAGVQDLERMEDAKFRKEQQQREREKAAEEKRVGEQIKGIQAETPAEYDESMGAITKPAQKLSRSQMLARQAEIYSASPDRANQMLGLQLSQAARAEESADRLKSIQTGYADTIKAINADPNKWVQENLAKFNADEYGGPGTKGVIAAPMSTPQGTVLNVMGPQGQQLQQIPVTKQDMMRVAKSMYFDELASIDPKYAELAMKQEQIGLEREGLGIKKTAEERQGAYQEGMLGVYKEKNRIDAEEMKARSSLWGAQRKQAESAMNGFSSFLSQDPESGVIYGVKKDGSIGSLQGPMDKSGKPVPLFPKTTGAKGAVAKVMKDEDGNTVAYNNEGLPIHNIVGGGLVVPLGVTSSDWTSMKKKATDAGIQISAGKDKEGSPVIAYKGKDGNFYSTLEEARKAKAK